MVILAKLLFVFSLENIYLDYIYKDYNFSKMHLKICG